MTRKIVFLTGMVGLMAFSGSVVAGDEAAIEQLLKAKESAWSAADGAGWARDYQEDSVVVNLAGSRLEGRDENAQRHDSVFAGPFAGTELDLSVEHIEMLGDDRALAVAKLAVSNIESMPEGLPDGGDGILHTRMSFLLEQDADAGWQIRFAQNTAVSPY
ncbi:SgcJ/EcaC family oxidoreductase [Thioalkalivibrio sp. ALJ1]|uniref:SgcJ/EcaC family oxidoreductase n=1 Tax=Thioalkalivibrio sp. ALJ1 TaxID=1158144 RepID=UPI00056E48AC|nr:SgcJ/EcaC family oxidoreductase [Thioalkalivibrio sp. ALJ1]